MSVLQRQILVGLGISVFVFILVSSAFIFVFPPPSWEVLWKKDIMDIPFLLFILSVSMGSGVLYGIFSGINWRKHIQSIDDYLRSIENGHVLDTVEKNPIAELQAMVVRMGNIQRNISEQTKISQKLVTERVEDQENRIQEIISQERNRLARELHDSVSQQLFAASMLMSAINEARPKSEIHETKQLKIVEEMIHQSQLEMRALLLHLRPVALKGKSLKQGIEELLIELSQKVSIDISWKLEDFHLDKGMEDHLFRIIQESVSNTLRHAQATLLEVLLIQRDGYTILRVVDDGIGFQVEERKAGSYGLTNMYERAVEIGGNLKIISLKNKGTRLEVKVPIIDKGEK